MVKIVALNSKYVHTLLSPYYLKANCATDNIEILQTNVNLAIDDILHSILANNPSIIAFSCYIFNINVVIELSKRIKLLQPNVVIIYGGPEVSFDADKYMFADYVICGEGEIAFKGLIQSILNGEVRDKVVMGELADLRVINPPYTQEYFDDVNSKIAYFEASRGCPYNCSYCMSGKSSLRKFPIEYVKTQLKKFEGKNIRVVKFVDRTFNADRKFAYEILRYILGNVDLHTLSFHFEIAGDLIDDDLISILEKSPKGLFQFEIGVQSFNIDTLNNVIRKCDIEKLKSNIIKIVAVNKCHIHTDLIAGLPHEDLVSLKESFNTLYSLGGEMLQLGFLKLLKGSKLRQDIEAVGGYNFHLTPPYEIISTPWITAEELDEVKIVEDAVDGYYNNGNFRHTLKRYCNNDAYSFYLDLGRINENKELFARYEDLYTFLIAKGEDIEEVRSHLVWDYLITNNSRALPPCLKKFDNNFKRKVVSKGIDLKKWYCVQIGININNGNIADGILAVDYNCLPYEVMWLSIDK